MSLKIYILKIIIFFPSTLFLFALCINFFNSFELLFHYFIYVQYEYLLDFLMGCDLGNICAKAEP
jgi:hypothetical protein